jgi:hypothetical protein
MNAQEAKMDKIERGRAAQALLENPLLQSALAGLEAAYTEAWRQARNVEAREDCHRYVRLVEKLAGDLQSIVTSGALEEARLKEITRGRKHTLWPVI